MHKFAQLPETRMSYEIWTPRYPPTEDGGFFSNGTLEDWLFLYSALCPRPAGRGSEPSLIDVQGYLVPKDLNESSAKMMFITSNIDIEHDSLYQERKYPLAKPGQTSMARSSQGESKFGKGHALVVLTKSFSSDGRGSSLETMDSFSTFTMTRDSIGLRIVQNLYQVTNSFSQGGDETAERLGILVRTERLGLLVRMFGTSLVYMLKLGIWINEPRIWHGEYYIPVRGVASSNKARYKYSAGYFVPKQKVLGPHGIWQIPHHVGESFHPDHRGVYNHDQLKNKKKYKSNT